MHKETQSSPTKITMYPFANVLKFKSKDKGWAIGPIGKIFCVVGECVMLGMTFHGGLIDLGHYFVVVTLIKRGSMKLPFPVAKASKVKDIVNGTTIWWKKDLHVCK